ncbi:hypothetical protein K438DRAFT_1787283 [Mycena galopus ATCC 62051]|nr:hypothetical protein K438DRAFT_1787283 [Mycena galopus ATCC 62051]
MDGKDWAQWDPEGYASALKSYLEFVHAGYLESHNLIDALPGPPVVPVVPAAFVGMNMIVMDEPDANGDVNTPSAGELATQNATEGGGDANMDTPAIPPLVDDTVDMMLEAGTLLPPPAPAHVGPAGPTATPAPAGPPPMPTPIGAATPAAAAPTPATGACNAAAMIASAAAAASVASATQSVSKKPPTWGVLGMTDFLSAEMLEMEDDEREAYAARLRWMAPFDLEHEKSLTRNKRLAMEMKLFGVASQFFGGSKRKHRNSKNKKSARRKGDEEEWDDDKKDSDSEESGGEDGEDRERPPYGRREGHVCSEQLQDLLLFSYPRSALSIYEKSASVTRPVTLLAVEKSWEGTKFGKIWLRLLYTAWYGIRNRT